jgi:CTD kinase subunit gamma
MQGSINSRINILYFLDSLCETCLLVSHSSSSSSNAQPSTSTAAAAAGGSDAASGSYVVHFTRDLRKIVELVVPEGRQGLPNLISTKQVCMLLLCVQWFRKELMAITDLRELEEQEGD